MVAVALLIIVAWPGSKLFRHMKAKCLAKKAEELICPASFFETPMQTKLTRYFEDRLHGPDEHRKNLLSFYKDESRLLYAVMIVAYEALLFSDFAGTEEHCSYQSKEQLRRILYTATDRLAERGYAPAEYCRKANDNIRAAEQFCADYGRSFRLFD